MISKVSWSSIGSTLSLEIAAGNSPNPSNWKAVSNGETLVGVSGRYFRYRAFFSGTGLSDDPELKSVSVTYTYPTSLTCTVGNATPEPGQEIGFSGYLRNSDGVGVGGKTVYLYKNGFDTGMASVTNENGYYGILTNASSAPGIDNYYVFFPGDETYLSSKSPDIQVTVGAPNQPPLLSNGGVTPLAGIVGENFTFEVVYTDADGDPPSYIKVYIDNVGHEMTKISGDYVGGATYRYVWSPTSGEIGKHSYYFKTSDGKNTSRLPSGDNTYSGPTVNPSRNISGYVKFKNVPIAGAKVTLDGHSTTTDENGYYEFSELEENKTYTIIVSASGYETYSETVFISSENNTLDINLIHVGGFPILWLVLAAGIVCGLMGGLVFRKREKSRLRRTQAP